MKLTKEQHYAALLQAAKELDEHEFGVWSPFIVEHVKKHGVNETWKFIKEELDLVYKLPVPHYFAKIREVVDQYFKQWGE